MQCCVKVILYSLQSVRVSSVRLERGVRGRGGVSGVVLVAVRVENGRAAGRVTEGLAAIGEESCRAGQSGAAAKKRRVQSSEFRVRRCERAGGAAERRLPGVSTKSAVSLFRRRRAFVLSGTALFLAVLAVLLYRRCRRRRLSRDLAVSGLRRSRRCYFDAVGAVISTV